MKESRKCPGLVVIAFIFLAALFVCPTPGSAEDIKAKGVYTLFPNGDLVIEYRLIPSMKLYQYAREAVKNPYLFLRWLSPARVGAEAVEPKLDFDDVNHSINFSTRILGSARNLGNHWELDAAKGTDFINLDEAKRTFFFNETGTPGTMGTIRGTSRLLMPAEAKQFKWDAQRRVVSYVLPLKGASSGRNISLLISGVVLMVLGIGLTVSSFLLKS